MTQTRNNLIYYSALPSLPGVEILEGRHIRNDFPRHIHRSLIIGQVTQGSRRIILEDQQFTIAANELFLLPPGEPHRTLSDTSAGHSYRVLCVPETLLQKLVLELTGNPQNRPSFAATRLVDDNLTRLFELTLENVREPDSLVHAESVLYDFLCHLLTTLATISPQSDAAPGQSHSTTRLCQFINEYYSEPLTLDQLATVARLSPFHLQRKFKHDLGITPHEYLISCRIRIARKLLTGRDQLADIALQVGFFDQSHFTRTFRKYVGISPGLFRAQNGSKTLK